MKLSSFVFILIVSYAMADSISATLYADSACATEPFSTAYISATTDNCIPNPLGTGSLKFEVNGNSIVLFQCTSQHCTSGTCIPIPGQMALGTCASVAGMFYGRITMGGSPVPPTFKNWGRIVYNGPQCTGTISTASWMNVDVCLQLFPGSSLQFQCVNNIVQEKTCFGGNVCGKNCPTSNVETVGNCTTIGSSSYMVTCDQETYVTAANYGTSPTCTAPILAQSVSVLSPGQRHSCFSYGGVSTKTQCNFQDGTVSAYTCNQPNCGGQCTLVDTSPFGTCFHVTGSNNYMTASCEMSTVTPEVDPYHQFVQTVAYPQGSCCGAGVFTYTRNGVCIPTNAPSSVYGSSRLTCVNNRTIAVETCTDTACGDCQTASVPSGQCVAVDSLSAQVNCPVHEVTPSYIPCGGGSSAGTIAGAVVGTLVGFAIIVMIIVCAVRSMKKSRSRSEASAPFMAMQR